MFLNNPRLLSVLSATQTKLLKIAVLTTENVSINVRGTIVMSEKEVESLLSNYGLHYPVFINKVLWHILISAKLISRYVNCLWLRYANDLLANQVDKRITLKGSIIPFVKVFQDW